MATDEDYPIDLSILVIDAQIFVAVNKFQFLPNKLIPNEQHSAMLSNGHCNGANDQGASHK